MLLDPGDTILFQGDSITDCGRRRDDGNSLGGGYAFMAASWCQATHPGMELRFVNRGISGNRAKDLKARWQEDCLDLKPTWVSILIGVNDCWRRYDRNDPTSVEGFAADYRAILVRCRDELGARLILCEPFLLEVPKVHGWREDLGPKIDAVRALAREFHAVYVPFDGIFAAASTRRDPAFWAGDGVHPSNAGHALMAQSWLRAVGALA